MNNRLWILGAADVEMAAIERLLLDVGESVAYAIDAETVGLRMGIRVHPGNAYKAVSYEMASDIHASGDAVVYMVECDIPSLDRSAIDVRRVDHHRAGDPGYGLPPESFLEASSIGQVLVVLASSGGDPADAICSACSKYLFIAAADHCLEHAYRGRCPGVDPDALMQWRAETRAAFQKRTVEAVLADVEAARKLLIASTIDDSCRNCGGYVTCFDSCDSSYRGTLPYADLRGESIPELPEAAAREGIPFLSTVRERPTTRRHSYVHPDPLKSFWEEGDSEWEYTLPGREKVVLMAAPADLVRRFLAGEIVSGLTDMYGDPARGFAGGYLTK